MSSIFKVTPGCVAVEIPVCTGQERVFLTFFEKIGKIKARLLNELGRFIKIKPENMPREFRQIKSSEAFQAFFKDVFAKVPRLSNEDPHLYIQQRGYGAGGNDAVEIVDELEFVAKVLPIVNKGKEDLLSLLIKENVAFLAGRTGAGKSMLANLLGERVVKGVRVRFDFKFDVEDPIFPISHSNTESCTGVPVVYSPPQKDYTYVDFAGFDDTRKPEQDTANLFFRLETLRNVKRMKIILVVDWVDIDKRGTNLPSTFNDLLQFLGYEDIQDERVAHLAQSIVLVVTHTPPHDNELIREVVGEALKDYGTAPYGLKSNAKAILRKLLDDERWETFSSPSQIGTAPKASSDRARIAALLEKNTRYLAKSETTIQAKVSAKYEGLVQNGLLALIANLKKQFGSQIANELTAYLKRFCRNVEGEKALKKFQKKYHEAISSEQPRTLFELLKLLQFSSGVFASGLLEHARKLDENIRFLIDLLPSKMASQIPHARDWLGELGIRNPLAVWDETLTKMTADATLHEVKITSATGPKVKLLLQGYFPRVSQITNELHKYASIESIEIHGLHTVLIDEDLSGDKLQGVDVTIIAPKWVVTNKRTIQLTGKEGNNPYTRRANDGANPGNAGTDGQAGLPGGNGGHFFGFGLVFSGIERLKVISKGGKGGPGQAGGVGQAGRDGDDGRVKHDFTKKTKKAHSAEYAARSGWDYVQIPPFAHGDDNYDQSLRNNGQDGQPGGNGGRGGIGGLGGLAGEIQFISLHDSNEKIQQEKKAGDEGEGEAGGAGALGGRRGRHWQGLWYSGKHGSKWNGHHQNRVRFDPENKDECPRATSGTEPLDKNSSSRAPQNTPKPFNVLELLYRYRECAIRGSNPLTIDTIEIFRNFYEKHSAILGKASVENFLAECDKMEDFFAEMEDKTKCLPLYRWMLERIQAFTVPNDNPVEIALMQCLYTYTSSKIFQLNAALQSRLIIDIRGYLKRAEHNVTCLKQSDHTVKVSFYEQEYIAQLSGKIKEADVFLKKLNDDIKAADKEVDASIKSLLKEIEDFKSKNQSNKIDIQKKRKQLQALISKRRTLGIINVAVQAIGCCFPPAGPIVAGVVGVGLTMMSNTRAGVGAIAEALTIYTDGISGALQGSKGALKSAQNGALTRVKAAALTTALLDATGESSKSEEDQIKAMDKAIAEIDNQQQQLNTFREGVNNTLAPSLHELVDGASDAQKALQGQSKMALEYTRLAVKRTFENVKKQVKEATKSFPAGDALVGIIQQLEEALETTANIYDHVEEYKERRTLVSYMARLAATTAQDPRIEVYKQKVLRNLVLEQYSRAVAAVRQWAFPFASLYLGDLGSLNQFTETKTMESLMDLVTRHIKLLQDKISGSAVEVNSAIDTYVWKGRFSDQAANGPFCRWDGKKYKREMIDLLKGETVTFFADVNSTSPEKNAIKFNHIELQIKSSDPIVQTELTPALRGLRVELRHSGLSYYRHDDRVYQMSNDDGFCIGYTMGKESLEPESANDVYSKMKSGEFMLSPYTRWAIKLEGGNPLFNKFASKLDTLEVHLVGKGQYVIAKNAAGKIKELEQYSGNILAAEIAPAASAKPSFIQDNPDDQANAQKENVNYLYQASDIAAIVQSPTIAAEFKNFHFIQGLQGEHLAERLEEIIGLAKSQKPVLCVYNISNVHWAAFSMVKGLSGQLIVLYKDSFGAQNTELVRILKSKAAEFKFHPGAEQAGDSTSCGIFALENLRIMARELTSDKEKFIQDFERQVFCSLATARAHRKGDFARFYVEGGQAFARNAAEQSEKARKLTAEHQAEAEQIAADLRSSVPAGFKVQTEEAERGAVQTIVVQIGSNDSSSTDYHYRIKATKDIAESQLEEILSQSKYAWFKKEDYIIEDNVFKVFKRIKF